MTDQKVLIFGSFTEEELRSLQTKPAKINVGITFGSLDSATLSSLGICDAKPREPDCLKICKPSQLESKQYTITTPCKFKDTSSVANGNGTTDYNLPHQSSGQAHIKEAVTKLSTSSNGQAFSDPKEGAYREISKATATNGPVTAPRNLLPRGLVNLGNLCFLNATIQSLLSCSPFVQLIQELRIRDIPKIGYPTLHAFVEFISDFELPLDTSFKRKAMFVLEIGRPFRPVMFESILQMFTPDIPNSLSGRPRQEDAQEFLSFLMHQMHDELLKLNGQISNGKLDNTSLILSVHDEDDKENWETVGPRNRSSVTRTQSFVPSKLSAIFGGQLRSVVKATGNKASATVEPFLLLHLNICPEPVDTIEDALRLFSAPETLEGYKMPAAGKAEVVSASKSVKILHLSKIMVLHLMRFTYGSEGSTKLHKPVHFPLELILGRELLVFPSSEARKYELVATITHHGGDPSKGHYTADARHPSGSWLRYDDASVTPIPISKVLHDQAYVLFYKQL